MFIRKRELNGQTYYSIVESYRESGRVRQRTVVSLGQCSTVNEAIKECEFWIDQYEELAEHQGSGYWFFYAHDGTLLTRVVGKEAQRRADKLTAKRAVLLHCRDVMVKRGTSQDTFCHYSQEIIPPEKSGQRFGSGSKRPGKEQ